MKTKILVAEDYKFASDIYGELADYWGYDIDVVPEGRTAFKRAAAYSYDVCLFDIDMPGMNGDHVARQIRRRLPFIPIIIMTANGNREERYRGVADDFIRKPYDIKQLKKKIDDLKVKEIAIKKIKSGVEIIEEGPMDKEHLTELQKLAEKNLRKVKFFDSPGSALIVHKNATNKISHDFNVKGQLMTTVLNRDSEKPTQCEVYLKAVGFMPQTYLTDTEYESLTGLEDEYLENYSEPSLSDEKEDK